MSNTIVVGNVGSLICKIKFLPYTAPHFCGYAGVDKDHPFFGMESDNPALYGLVHGGVTYSEMEGNLWFLGFDTAHGGDPWREQNRPLQAYEKVWTLEKLLEELHEFAKQIAEAAR